MEIEYELAIKYELAIEKDGTTRISVYTRDPDVAFEIALEINERIEQIAQRALDSIGRVKAEDE